ncbi:unnamed protein product [Brassica oleracea var. botrytis]|uniref:Uncharacterized protein n=2 Tax=Brassica TaxID=3705 RepID=A0A3P6FQD5_BRAOL|nr:unnamed protein product [Brassica napus]VDD50976.1 unnamed protein product [Brassica oleracea]
MLLLGGASQPIKRRVFVLPPLRWDCSDSANQEMYALPRCKVIHPLSMSNEPVSPIPEEYFRFRNHSEMLDYFDNEYISSIIAEGLCQGLNLALIVAELNEFIITAPSWSLVFAKVDVGGSILQGIPTTGVGSSGLHIKKPPVRASSKMAKKAYVA